MKIKNVVSKNRLFCNIEKPAKLIKNKGFTPTDRAPEKWDRWDRRSRTNSNLTDKF